MTTTPRPPDANAPTFTGRGLLTQTGTLSTLRPQHPSQQWRGIVEDYSLRAFLDGFVLQRFPDGFIVAEVRGVWKGGREDSLALSVVYPKANARDFGVRLEEIRAAYCARFKQDSVLCVDTTAEVSFF